MKTVFGSAITSLLLLSAIPAKASPILLANGDFSAGNTGFLTDYTLADNNSYTTPPSYNTVQNPSTSFTNGYASYTDHTGDAAGLMLFVDGASGPRFWYESPVLAANANYTFSFWATSAGATSQADLQLSVNGNPEDAGHQLNTVGQYVQYTDTFTTDAAGPYTVALSDLNGVAFGNDFTVDDLVLNVSAVPEPSTWAMMLLGFMGLGFVSYRRKQIGNINFA